MMAVDFRRPPRFLRSAQLLGYVTENGALYGRPLDKPLSISEMLLASQMVFRGDKANPWREKPHPGLTTARITMAIISNVGASLIMR